MPLGVGGPPRIVPCDALLRSVPRRSQADLTGDSAPPPAPGTILAAVHALALRCCRRAVRRFRGCVTAAANVCASGTRAFACVDLFSGRSNMSNDQRLSAAPTLGETSATQAPRVARIPHEFSKGGLKVDRSSLTSNLSFVNLRHLKTKLSRLNLNKAAREAAALKTQFRREDLALAAQGKEDEIWARNRRLLGIRAGAKGKLVGFNGVRFE